MSPTYAAASPPASPVRARLCNRRFAESFALECSGLNYDATISRFDGGNLAEIFLNCIPRSRHNPKILWVDDAEIVGDRIT